ncbi:LysR family transcriptional regulator [Silvimonas amylolytica]|uniref:LysR family transcriptional regulator n=1 Tax=Silvimonas amylolytica TaxID=449663 RepID=A0ABQ2PPI5_9NEIS|nr:LysR family transcriptional regulator [Silvimonas amylolytica]GGP27150.1 LysR family transcriptional regulator [Silvimonas amylolytica]
MRDVDLNLLSIFDAIMTEGSVTKAAQQLAMTQSAVSNAVARMRVVWKDPLFIKEGRGIRPTPRASAIWRDIGLPLATIRETINPAPFDPATTARRFRIAATDHMTYPLWPPLRNLLEARAPGIDILAVPIRVNGLKDQFDENEIDLAVGVKALPGGELRQQWMFDTGFVCAMRRNHPLANRPLSLENFLSADHLLVSLSGDPVGFVDELLLQKGMRRRVAMTVNNFYGVIDLLTACNLIAVVPESVVLTHPRRAEIHATPLPFEMPQSHAHMVWHNRCERDPGHQWLRQTIMDICMRVCASCESRLLPGAGSSSQQWQDPMPALLEE